MDIYIKAVLQTLAAFVAILVYARLLGKQQMSQLTFYDYVAGITLGNIAASMALDEGPTFWVAFLVLTLFFALTYLIGVTTEKSRPIRKFIEGEPVILVHNGKILEHNMSKARYNMENLMMQLREKDCFNIDDIEFALAETNGILTVLKKAQKRTVTPSDLNVDTEYEGIPSELIVDGKIIYQNLTQNNLDEKWLIEQLNYLGFNSPKEISYASIDVNKKLYVDEINDRLQDVTDISD